MEGWLWKCWLRKEAFRLVNLARSYQNRWADQAARRNGCWSRYRWFWSPPVGGIRDRTGTAHDPLALCCLLCGCHLLECQDHYRKWQLKLQKEKHPVSNCNTINGSHCLNNGFQLFRLEGLPFSRTICRGHNYSHWICRAQMTALVHFYTFIYLSRHLHLCGTLSKML